MQVQQSQFWHFLPVRFYYFLKNIFMGVGDKRISHLVIYLQTDES